MERIARIGLPGAERHVTHRGNKKQHVSFVEGENRVAHGLAWKQRQRCGRRMENHHLTDNLFRLVALPDTGDALESSFETSKASVSDNATRATFRRILHTGCPYGGNTFLDKLETRLGRRVRPLPKGWTLKWRKAKSEKREKKTRHEHNKEGENERKGEINGGCPHLFPIYSIYFYSTQHIDVLSFIFVSLSTIRCH